MCIRMVIVVLSAIVHGEMYFKDTETCILDIKKKWYALYKSISFLWKYCVYTYV